MTPLRPIGFISPLLDGFYFGGVLTGVQQMAQQHGRQVIAIQGTIKDLCRSKVAFGHVAGWVVLLNVEGTAELAETGLPLVAVSTVPTEIACPTVLPDNNGGAYATTSHLISMGHTRIAFIGYLGNNDIRQRYEGYQRALVDHNIVLDPQLVFDVPDTLEGSGAMAAKQLLDRRLPCTGIVAGTDDNAIGALQYLREQGKRVPEEIAIAGFDDIHIAQHTSPPLTTVRQRFDALGRQAAAILIEQLAGRRVEPGIQYVPTELIVRRSSGASLDLSKDTESSAPTYAGPNWREVLERNLVHQATSQPLSPSTPASAIWPGAATLAQAVDAAVHEKLLLPETALEQAWRQVMDLTLDPETLYTLIRLLERAGGDQAEQAADSSAATARLEALTKQLWQLMMRARIDGEMRQIVHMSERAETNYEFAMLASAQESMSSPRTLSWLSKTTVRWACLGLWPEDDHTGMQQLEVAGVYCSDNRPVPLQAVPATSFPPLHCLPLPEQPEQDEIIALFPVESGPKQWGVLALCGKRSNPLRNGLEHMRMWASLLGVALERERLVATLQVAYSREHALSDTIRELGCPVIPLLSGVVLVPLIGGIDSSRAQHIVDSLMHQVAQLQARTAVIDVTGVALVDTSVANALLGAAKILKLLGSQVILTGIRPEVAQTLVGLGVDLAGVRAYGTLQAGIAVAISQGSYTKHDRSLFA